jgi:UDP-GlcNAc:undecaprenyl-phosphate GlcNAc-1-phosphate transferase
VAIEPRLLLSIALASAIVYWATPFAIRIAARLDFYDHPVGYKGHDRPTPYLGGAAVIAGFAVAAALLGGEPGRTLPLLGGVAVLWAVGTVDDRRTLRPSTRVAVEAALAALLWAVELGWDLQAGPVVDLAATVVWIVAVVNAFNLFDNMDGAASSMAAVVTGGLAVYGAVTGNVWLAVCATALSGACLGFLPHNLFASPARIFLGDGGSMPIGFAVAALTMAGASSTALPWQSLAAGLLFVGIPVLDTALVTVSRRRRGIPILTGGRDHLTHRTRARVQTARAVALALGGAQAIVSALAIVAERGGSAMLVAAVMGYLAAAGVTIAALDARTGAATVAAPATTGGAARRLSVALLVPVAAGICASPFFGGYYEPGLWVPIGLGLVATAAAAVIAIPFGLTRPAALALAGLAGLGLLSIVSSAWADSVEDATVAGDRWLVYTVLLIVLLALVRTTRAAAWLLGLVAAGAVVVAAIVTARLLGANATAPFLGPRLNDPLGYINGQGAFFALAAWPCIAAAEQRRSALLSGAGLGAATLLGSLAILTQSRGVALGFAAAAVVVLAAVPGRTRRAWTLAALAAALAAAAPALLGVYDHGVTAEHAHRAALAAVLAALGAGVAWAALTAVSRPLERSAPWTPRLALGAALVVALGGAAGLGASAGRIADTVRDQYHSFVRLTPDAATGAGERTSRLLSGAGNRYDYWRVAWSAARAHPAGGVGAGNFAVPYFRERATAEDVRQPHSIELQTLSELGIPGAVALVAFLGALGWGAARWRRSSAVAVGAIGILAAWLAHTSVDWLHLIPGVTAIALVAAAALLCGGDAQPAAAARSASLRPARRILLAGAAATLLVGTGVALSRQGLAERYRSAAQAALARDPARALVEADRWLRIDPHGLDAYYVKAAALARFDRGEAATRTLLVAARRAPRTFVTWALLGDLASRMGERRVARAYYAHARRLNPREPGLAR